MGEGQRVRIVKNALQKSNRLLQQVVFHTRNKESMFAFHLVLNANLPQMFHAAEGNSVSQLKHATFDDQLIMRM